MSLRKLGVIFLWLAWLIAAGSLTVGAFMIEIALGIMALIVVLALTGFWLVECFDI